MLAIYNPARRGTQVLRLRIFAGHQEVRLRWPAACRLRITTPNTSAGPSTLTIAVSRLRSLALG